MSDCNFYVRFRFSTPKHSFLIDMTFFFLLTVYILLLLRELHRTPLSKVNLTRRNGKHCLFAAPNYVMTAMPVSIECYHTILHQRLPFPRCSSLEGSKKTLVWTRLGSKRVASPVPSRVVRIRVRWLDGDEESASNSGTTLAVTDAATIILRVSHLAS